MMVERNNESEKEGYEEYEIVPLSPLRKLERRVRRLEAERSVSNKELFSKLLEVSEANQTLVERLIENDRVLREELGKLSTLIEDLVNNLKELIVYIKLGASREVSGIEKVGGEAETAIPSTEDVALKILLEKLIEENRRIIETNQTITDRLEELSRKLGRILHLPPPLVIRRATPVERR